MTDQTGENLGNLISSSAAKDAIFRREGAGRLKVAAINIGSLRPNRYSCT